MRDILFEKSISDCQKKSEYFQMCIVTATTAACSVHDMRNTGRMRNKVKLNLVRVKALAAIRTIAVISI